MRQGGSTSRSLESGFVMFLENVTFAQITLGGNREQGVCCAHSLRTTSGLEFVAVFGRLVDTAVPPSEQIIKRRLNGSHQHLSSPLF